MTDNRTRIPANAASPLTHEPIQINFCKKPTCVNFGVPARVTSQSGPSAERDPCYTISSTSKGKIPAFKCKACGEKLPVKSNRAISEEMNRMTKYLKEFSAACRNQKCRNYGMEYSSTSRLYCKAGRTHSGSQLLKCKSCGKSFSAEHPSKLQHDEVTRAVFVSLVNKSPVRRTLEMVTENTGTELGAAGFYRRITHIYKRSLEFMAAFDKQLMAGRFPLGDLRISTDHQEFMINWKSRQDRRNTLIRSIASVDNASRFIFLANVNYDMDADREAINQDALAREEYTLPEAYRHYARLWLSGDEFAPNRTGGIRQGIRTFSGLQERIEAEYQSTIERDDVESIPEMGKTPSKGMLTHQAYTTYSHFMVLYEMLKGAEHSLHCLDHETMLRAGYLTAFENAIRKGRSNGMYVSINKTYTVDERKVIRKQANADFRNLCRALLRTNSFEECVRIKMRENIRNAVSLGFWHDQWVSHPFPRMDEPEKSVCWLTGRDNLADERAVDLFLNSTMSGSDNFFMQTRRRLSLLERPIATPSSQNRVWHGYCPYNPAMVEKSLKILQCYLNYCKVGDDKATPAMRLGITDRVHKIDDILGISFKKKEKLVA